MSQPQANPEKPFTKLTDSVDLTVILCDSI